MKVSQNNEYVEIVLSHRGYAYVFRFSAQTNWAAGLLQSALFDVIWRKFEEARAEAYRQGWADAKAKRAKRTSFSGLTP